MTIQQRNKNGTIKSDYGDAPDQRYCPGCNSYYPPENFYKDVRGTDGLTRRCKQCHSRKSYASRKKRPALKSERYESLRKWILVKKYNTSIEEFKTLLREQNGVCKICGRKQIKWWSNESNGGLSIDHHHFCGGVRGLLCSDCNTAIGLLKEDIKNFEQAIESLRDSTCCEKADS
jgi:hypothetical protein